MRRSSLRCAPEQQHSNHPREENLFVAKGNIQQMDTRHTIDFRYAPPYRWTAICRPDDPYKTLVREDGALLYGYRSNTFISWHFKRVIEFGVETTDKPIRSEQHTESARVPVVVTTTEYPHAKLEMRTFAALDGEQRRTDVVLWTIRAHDDVDEFLTGIHVEGFERNCVFVGRTDAPVRVVYAIDPAKLPVSANSPAESSWLPENEAEPLPGEAAFVSSPQPLIKVHSFGFRPCSALAMESVILRAGESVSGAIMFPLNHTEVSLLDYGWAQRALEAERAYWARLPLPVLQIEIPDPDVMDMLTACARNILQAREIVDGLPVFQVGASVYRGLWVVDGHFLLEAAQYLGYREDASAAIDTLLRRVHPDGSIAQFPFHSKETGISIATLIRQCELLGDDDRLRQLWPVIRNATAFIEGLREEARALPPDDPCCNLLPASFADGGAGGKRGEYTTALWILFGLKWAANAARRLGFSEDTARIQADYDSLMSDFLAHAGRNMRTLEDGTPYLPMVYPGSGDHNILVDYEGTPHPLDSLQPESALWALCQAIWPGEVFAPDDPLVQNLNRLHDLRDDKEDVPATTGWLPYKGVWTYHTSFAAHVWLYSGRPDKAIDYLYGFANHAAPTRVWREEQAFADAGHNRLFGDMPHNWASAEFIRLIRHLLVFERGETLELLPGLPEEWVKPGAVIRLERTPTRFGPVTLLLHVQDGGWIDLELCFALGSRRPERRVVHLPNMVEVAVNGELVALSNGVFDLPTEGDVRIRARKI
jgi:hypothetical protein